jgi:DNA repair protein RadA/Sms
VPSFAIFAEDDDAELHIRLAAAAGASGVEIGDLRQLVWRSAVVDPAELVEVTDRGTVLQTPYFEWLQRTVDELGSRLVVLDAATNLFGGDEIKRRQVNAFLMKLRRLAIRIDGAVLLLAHPSAQGIASKSGLSGSTHWSNGVRQPALPHSR